MVESLKTSFLPLVQANGWLVRKRPPEFSNPELNRLFPFGQIYREDTSGIQLIDLQFDKYQRLRFRIVIGTAPKQGVVSPYGLGLIPPEGMSAAETNNAHIVAPQIWLTEWFRTWFWQRTDQKTMERMVGNLAVLWPEVEEFFSSGTAGKHMKNYSRWTE